MIIKKYHYIISVLLCSTIFSISIQKENEINAQIDYFRVAINGYNLSENKIIEINKLILTCDKENYLFGAIELLNLNIRQAVMLGEEDLIYEWLDSYKKKRKNAFQKKLKNKENLYKTLIVLLEVEIYGYKTHKQSIKNIIKEFQDDNYNQGELFLLWVNYKNNPNDESIKQQLIKKFDNFSEFKNSPIYIHYLENQIKNIKNKERIIHLFNNDSNFFNLLISTTKEPLIAKHLNHQKKNIPLELQKKLRNADVLSYESINNTNALNLLTEGLNIYLEAEKNGLQNDPITLYTIFMFYDALYLEENDTVYLDKAITYANKTLFNWNSGNIKLDDIYGHSTDQNMLQIDDLELMHDALKITLALYHAEKNMPDSTLYYFNNLIISYNPNKLEEFLIQEKNHFLQSYLSFKNNYDINSIFNKEQVIAKKYGEIKKISKNINLNSTYLNATIQEILYKNNVSEELVQNLQEIASLEKENPYKKLTYSNLIELDDKLFENHKILFEITKIAQDNLKIDEEEHTLNKQKMESFETLGEKSDSLLMPMFTDSYLIQKHLYKYFDFNISNNKNIRKYIDNKTNSSFNIFSNLTYDSSAKWIATHQAFNIGRVNATLIDTYRETSDDEFKSIEKYISYLKEIEIDPYSLLRIIVREKKFHTDYYFNGYSHRGIFFSDSESYSQFKENNFISLKNTGINYLDDMYELLKKIKKPKEKIEATLLIADHIITHGNGEGLFPVSDKLKIERHLNKAIEIAKRNKYYQYENDLWIRLGFISNSLEGIGSIDNTDNQYFLNALELQKKYNLRSIVLYNINLYQEKFSKEFSAFLINNHHHTYFLDLNELWFYDALLSEYHKAAFLHTNNLYYSYISQDPIYSYNSSIEEYKRAYNNFKKFYDLLEIENLFDGQKLEIKTTNWRVERNQRLFENNIDKDFCILLSTSLLYNLEEAERGEYTQSNEDAAVASIALIKETIRDLIELNEMEEAERLLEKIEPYAWAYESITADSWHIDFYNGTFDNGQGNFAYNDSLYNKYYNRIVNYYETDYAWSKKIKLDIQWTDIYITPRTAEEKLRVMEELVLGYEDINDIYSQVMVLYYMGETAFNSGVSELQSNKAASYYLNAYKLSERYENIFTSENKYGLLRGVVNSVTHKEENREFYIKISEYLTNQTLNIEHKLWVLGRVQDFYYNIGELEQVFDCYKKVRLLEGEIDIANDERSVFLYANAMNRMETYFEISEDEISNELSFFIEEQSMELEYQEIKEELFDYFDKLDLNTFSEELIVYDFITYMDLFTTKEFLHFKKNGVWERGRADFAKITELLIKYRNNESIATHAQYYFQDLWSFTNLIHMWGYTDAFYGFGVSFNKDSLNRGVEVISTDSPIFKEKDIIIFPEYLQSQLNEETWDSLRIVFFREKLNESDPIANKAAKFKVIRQGKTLNLKSVPSLIQPNPYSKEPENDIIALADQLVEISMLVLELDPSPNKNFTRNYKDFLMFYTGLSYYLNNPEEHKETLFFILNKYEEISTQRLIEKAITHKKILKNEQELLEEYSLISQNITNYNNLNEDEKNYLEVKQNYQKLKELENIALQYADKENISKIFKLENNLKIFKDYEFIVRFAIGDFPSSVFYIYPNSKTIEPGLRNWWSDEIVTEQDIELQIYKIKNILTRDRDNENSIKEELEILTVMILGEIPTLPSELFNKENRKKILIIPEGPMHKIPTELLIYKDENNQTHYFGELFNISYAPSLISYVQLSQRKNKEINKKQALLVSANPASSGLGDIKYADKEIEQIETILTEKKFLKKKFTVKSLKSDNIDENSFKKLNLNKYKYIHIASHGTYEIGLPEMSGLILGANTVDEDGILQPHEVFPLDLRADLVTLSSCFSGFGEIDPNEGNLGIYRKFLIAGSKSVIISLWNVNDESTSILFTQFYQYLKDGDSKSEALQKAKMYLKNETNFSSPFYWAPFILIGES